MMVVLLPTKLKLSQNCFRQVQGVAYDEIFSLVSMIKSLSESCWQLPHFMKFGKWMSNLHSLMYFLKKLYMMQPEGFIDPKGANKVCKAPAIHIWTGASLSELE